MKEINVSRNMFYTWSSASNIILKFLMLGKSKGNWTYSMNGKNSGSLLYPKKMYGLVGENEWYVRTNILNLCFSVFVYDSHIKHNTENLIFNTKRYNYCCYLWVFTLIFIYKDLALYSNNNHGNVLYHIYTDILIK